MREGDLVLESGAHLLLARDDLFEGALVFVEGGFLDEELDLGEEVVEAVGVAAEHAGDGLVLLQWAVDLLAPGLGLVGAELEVYELEFGLWGFSLLLVLLLALLLMLGAALGLGRLELLLLECVSLLLSFLHDLLLVACVTQVHVEDGYQVFTPCAGPNITSLLFFLLFCL